jgi:hypothetical protein
VDCERLGILQDNGEPDLNRLHKECVWDVDLQRCERVQ